MEPLWKTIVLERLDAGHNVPGGRAYVTVYTTDAKYLEPVETEDKRLAGSVEVGTELFDVSVPWTAGLAAIDLKTVTHATYNSARYAIVSKVRWGHRCRSKQGTHDFATR